MYAGIALDFSALNGNDYNLNVNLSVEELTVLVEKAKEKIFEILGVQSSPKLVVLSQYT
jgi:hypothetical protein